MKITKEIEEILKKLNEILGIVEPNEIIHPSTPGDFAERIKDTREKAFQRAILFSESSVLNDNQNVTWYDIELPVVFSRNPRRPCIDLIGREQNGEKRFVLCELKFNSISNDPLYAVRELLGYYRGIIMNAIYLKEHSIHHTNPTCRTFDWEWFLANKPLLVVTANTIYWNNWRRRHFDEQTQKIQKLSKYIGVEILLYETPNYNFEVQKEREGNLKYKPKLKLENNEPNKPWERIN